MAIEKVESPATLTDQLLGAAVAWDVKRDDHISRAEKIRADAEDVASRMVFTPTPEGDAQRKTVLGKLYAQAERDASVHDFKARLYTERARLAREKQVYRDDGDSEHNSQYADLHGAAVRAGRVVFEQDTNPFVWRGDLAPDSFHQAVDRRFQERAGIPRSGLAAAARRAIMADSMKPSPVLG